MNVSALSVFPLKSGKGTSREEARVEARGLEGDRCWLAVDEVGKAITQRDVPALALLEAEAFDGGLRLRAPDSTCLEVGRQGSVRRVVEVWEQAIDAVDAGPVAAEWLSGYLGRPARLVYMDDASVRRVSLEGDARSWSVSFADELPLLVIGEGSLADLNGRLATPLRMDRFRPNIVVRGAAPFAEDLWARVAVGEVELELVKPCSRCMVITVDQQTAEMDARQEPLRTLSDYRRTTGGSYPHEDKRVYFGWRAAALSVGSIRLGDEVRVLETRARLQPEPSSGTRRAPGGQAR